MSNNILLAVLGIGAIMMFVSQDDKKEESTIRQQQTQAAMEGDTQQAREQAKADHPGRQLKFERDSAIQAINQIQQEYAKMEAWVKANEALISHEGHFPPVFWSRVVEVKKELSRLGEYATGKLYRSAQNPEDQNFWGHFDELWKNVGALYNIEVSLRSNKTKALPPPNAKPDHPLDKALETDATGMELVEFEQIKGVQGTIQMTPAELTQFVQDTFKTMVDTRQQVTQYIQQNKIGYIENNSPAMTADTSNQAFRSLGPSSTTQDDDENMMADAMNKAGLNGANPSDNKGPTKPLAIKEHGEVSGAGGKPNFDRGQKKDKAPDKNPAPDPPKKKGGKKKRRSASEAGGPDTQSIRDGFNQSGKRDDTTAMVPFKPGQSQESAKAQQQKGQTSIDLDTFRQQLTIAHQKLVDKMDGESRNAKDLQQVKALLNHLRNMTPYDGNKLIYRQVTFQADIKKGGLSKAQMDKVKKNPFYIAWRTTFSDALYAKYMEYVNKRKAYGIPVHGAQQGGGKRRRPGPRNKDLPTESGLR